MDMKINMEWLREHGGPPCNRSDVFTVFICPGDISSDLKYVREAFELLVDMYDAVCFVPGNHDVWKRNDDPSDTSVTKLQDLLLQASICGVYTGPLHIFSTTTSVTLLDIFPLYSWYQSSWDREPDLSDPSSIAKEKVKHYADFVFRSTD